MQEWSAQLVTRRARAIRTASLVVMIAAFIALLRALPLEPFIVWLVERADAFGPWAPVGFVALFVGLTVFCLPGAPLNVIAGVIWGPWVGGALSVVASNASAATGFLLSRVVARRRAERLLQQYPRLAAVHHTVGAEGGWRVVAAVRLSHALPFGLQNILLGLTRVHFGLYLLTTALVTLPGIFVVAYLGHIGASALTGEDGGGDPHPWRWAARIGGLLVAMSAIAYLGRFVRRAIEHRMAAHRPPGAAPLHEHVSVRGTLALAAAALVLLGAAVGAHLGREALRAWLTPEALEESGTSERHGDRALPAG